MKKIVNDQDSSNKTFDIMESSLEESHFCRILMMIHQMTNILFGQSFWKAESAYFRMLRCLAKLLGKTTCFRVLAVVTEKRNFSPEAILEY